MSGRTTVFAGLIFLSVGMVGIVYFYQNQYCFYAPSPVINMVAPNTPVNYLKDMTISDVDKLTQLLERLKDITNVPKNKRNIDSVITFVKSILESNRSSLITKPWDVKAPDWKDNFYPGAKYTGEVCPETYVRKSNRTPAWPYFHLLDSCAQDSPATVSRLVTIALNFQSYTENQSKDITLVIENIRKMYPDMSISVAFPGHYKYTGNLDKMNIISISAGDKPGAVWNQLVTSVNTRYVFLGRDILDFDSDIQFERLIREISPLGVNIVGSAFKKVSDGRWTHGCYQLGHRNHTTVYTLGYLYSFHDCIYCDSIQGPFLARTEFMKKNLFDTKLPESLLFYDYFFYHFVHKNNFAICPDSMLNVRDQPADVLKREDWLPFVKKRGINVLKSPSGDKFTYSCEEASLSSKRHKGLAVSPCSLQKLANHIKFVMRTCRKHNIICELNAGTTLGAVKFGAVLPWERDADILIYRGNFSVFGRIKSDLKNAGYSLGFTKTKQHTYYGSGGAGWSVDLYPKPGIMDSAVLRSEGKKPTLVLLDGEWVETPRNVGLEVRDRYGPEAYHHAQHYSVLSKTEFSQSIGYFRAGRFTGCPTPGAHNCLDQYTPDGSLEFMVPPL